MPNTVLVPVDGSSFAEHALPYALDIARRTDATLHLALVHIPVDSVSASFPLADALEAHVAEQRDQDAGYMEGLVDRLGPAGARLHPALLRGRVSSTLEHYVEEERIELVVMTTHGRGGLQRAWLGSTADSLIRHCMIPILLLRPSEETRALRPEGRVEVRRIVAALDGSDTAETALRDALALGITDGATLHLVHVLQPPVGSAAPYLPHPMALSREEAEAREAHAARYLDEVAARPWLQDRDARPRLVTAYQAAPAILDLAEEVDADLIVVGTHGRGGLRRMILGSVADKVIRGTHRPVLVHRGVGRIARIAQNRDRHQTSEHAGSRAHP